MAKNNGRGGEMNALAVAQFVTAGVPCLWPGCAEVVTFAGTSTAADRKRHASCPNGHGHYSDGAARYGTEASRV